MPHPTIVAGIDRHAIPPWHRRRLGLCSRVMAVCRSCGDEVDELVSVKVGGKTRKLCESCADRIREESEVAEESEAVVQKMMDFKGRR